MEFYDMQEFSNNDAIRRYAYFITKIRKLLETYTYVLCLN